MYYGINYFYNVADRRERKGLIIKKVRSEINLKNDVLMLELLLIVRRQGVMTSNKGTEFFFQVRDDEHIIVLYLISDL